MTEKSPGATGASHSALDRFFDVLSHPYRRRILTILAETNPRDEREFDAEELQAKSDDLELFTAELYHTHLPKLAESGFIDWDRETGTIRRGPRFDEISPLVELMVAHEDELPADWP